MNKDLLYYKDSFIKEFDAFVKSCEEKDGRYETVLSDTAFYPLGGGQLCDTGYINGTRITDVFEKGGMVVHVSEKGFSEGEKVHGVIDWAKRFDHMQQHSGEHLLSGIVFKKYGFENVGFHMNDRLVTVDYSGEIPENEILQLEKECNDAVLADLPVSVSWPDADALKKMEYRSKIELSGDVRIVSTGPWDVCACCGTHVMTTGQIGGIRLLSVRKNKGGSRVEMICGARITESHRNLFDQNEGISRLLSSKGGETLSAVEKLRSDMLELQKQNACLWDVYCESVNISASEDQKIFFEENVSADQLRLLCLKLGEKREKCGVFCPDGDGMRYVVYFKGDNQKVLEMNRVLGGRGGGKDGFAQGRVSCSRDDAEAFFKGL